MYIQKSQVGKTCWKTNEGEIVIDTRLPSTTLDSCYLYSSPRYKQISVVEAFPLDHCNSSTYIYNHKTQGYVDSRGYPHRGNYDIHLT